MTVANHVNDTTFEREVLNAEGPVLVDFYATWCPPCKTLSPVIDELAREFDGRAKVVKLDIEEATRATQANRVSAVPTLVLFEGGRPVQRWTGAQPKRVLAGALESRLVAG